MSNAVRESVRTDAADADRRATPAAETPKAVVPSGRSPGHSSDPGQDGKPVATQPASLAVPKPVPPAPVRTRPPVAPAAHVVVTRCVPVLVPVTSYHTQPDWYGQPVTVATTRYEWRTHLVREQGPAPTCR